MGIIFTKNKLPVFRLTEVRKHNSRNDCWIIVKNKVYDVTNFINKHPVGYQAILNYAGTDCTMHLSFHSNKARKILSKYLIGRIC